MSISFNVDPSVATNETVRVKVWLCHTVANPNFTNFPPGAAVPTEWDPSLFPNFDEFGSVKRSFELLVTPGRPYELKHRLRVRKVDQNVNAIHGYSWYWVYSLARVGVAGLLGENVITVQSHNLSFAPIV